MLALWFKMAALSWPKRWCVKTLLFAVVLFFVLYPNPVLFVKQVQHLLNVEALIEPNMAAMPEINREIDHDLSLPNAPKEVQAVERFVYRHIKYEYDWNLWGNVDYWPTASEVWALKREDCDGRAILAASILRSRGYKDAKIVGNLDHVWVEAGGKGLMGPQADKNFQKKDGKTQITLPSFQTWAITAAMISQFPIPRSLIVLLSLLLLCYHPGGYRGGLLAAVVVGGTGFAILFKWGLVFLADEKHTNSTGLLVAVGLVAGSVGLALLAPHCAKLVSRLRGLQVLPETVPIKPS